MFIAVVVVVVVVVVVDDVCLFVCVWLFACFFICLCGGFGFVGLACSVCLFVLCVCVFVCL